MKEITWEEFRETGLLLLVNQFLHIFGIAIVVQTGEDGEGMKVYPARVPFRGFKESSTEKAYTRISKYMKERGEELYDEVVEDE